MQEHHLISDGFENSVSKFVSSVEWFGYSSEAHARTIQEAVESLRAIADSDAFTARDRFAAEAMREMIRGDYGSWMALASDAYALADAMIEQRRKVKA